MNRIKYITLVLSVVVIGVLHYVTPGQMIFFHSTLSKLSYFPIVMGAVWFGLRGGISLAVLTSLGFIPHLLIFRGFGFESYLSELIEVFLYLSIGTIIGYISGKEMKLKSRYKQISEKLEVSYEHLHEETRLLIEVEERLRQNQKLSALGEVSASVAHEIKNPLASIKGVSEILADEFGEEHPKKEFMDIMKNEINRLDMTVTDMLKSIKSPVKKRMVELKNLTDILDSILVLLNERIKENDIRIRQNIKPDIKHIKLENRSVYQIFFNLILNALDSVEKNGMIRISSERMENNLIVRIEDNGPGVSADSTDHIFKPFFSSKKNGTGLGLSIVKRIVESLNGKISIEKSDLGGADFKVVLPI